MLVFGMSRCTGKALYRENHVEKSLYTVYVMYEEITNWRYIYALYWCVPVSFKIIVYVLKLAITEILPIWRKIQPMFDNWKMCIACHCLTENKNQEVTPRTTCSHCHTCVLNKTSRVGKFKTTVQKVKKVTSVSKITFIHVRTDWKKVQWNMLCYVKYLDMNEKKIRMKLLDLCNIFNKAFH